MVFQEERPLWVDKSIHAESEPTLEFSFPSSHSWIASVTWLMVMHYFGDFQKKIWVYLLCSTVAIMTCFSRMWLGVHYPHDIIAGITFGTLTFLFRDYFILYDEKNIFEVKSLSTSEILNEKIKGKIESKSILSKVSNEKGIETKNSKRNLKKKEEDDHSNKSNSNYLSLAICMASFAFLLQVDDSHLKQQVGCFFTIGGILTTIILRPTVCFLEDEGTKRRFLRFLLGVVPLALGGYLFKKLLKNFNNVNPLSMAIFMFSFGIVLSLWALYLSHALFQKVGLGKISNGDEEDDE